MTKETLRTVTIDRVGLGRYRVTNDRGDSIEVGEGTISAVELLLAAMGCCSAADVDHMTSRKSEPLTFAVAVTGDKIRDEQGNRLVNLEVVFDITFPTGAAGDEARRVLPRAIAQSRDRLCTVSRTVALQNDVTFRLPSP